MGPGLNGTTTWTLNGEIQLLHPGESLFIPRGTPHFFANVHEEVGRVVCLQTPGVMGPEYYREIARHYQCEHVDPAGIRDVMCRYGVDPLMRHESSEQIVDDATEQIQLQDKTILY